jgi:hypothetical protein
MERYIAIKESFFWKWRQRENSKYFLLMASLIYDASYIDTEKLRKGCLEYVAKKFAKSIGVTEKILANKINYLKDVGEVKIIKEDERRILEVVYYDYYVITPDTQNTNKETVYEDSDGKKYYQQWEKLPSVMVKSTIGNGKNYHRIHYYNNTNNNNNNNNNKNENFVVADVSEKKDSETSVEDNKNEITLTENRENMEEYWKQFGNANNPTWETFSGTLPCGRQVYNLSGEYVCYIKTYVEKGYERTLNLFLHNFWEKDIIQFATNNNINPNIVTDWLKEFKERQLDGIYSEHEIDLKKDFSGEGEKFYRNLYNHVLNFLRKKVADRKRVIDL